MDFKTFQIAVQRQFNVMKGHELFRVNIGKDQLWDNYIASFPEGTNPVYKERTEHDCQCCKHFIRAVGDMVAVINGEVVSIWDITVTGDNAGYQAVADSMSKLVKSGKIDDVFLHLESNVGVDKSFALLGEKPVSWNHFQLQLPTTYVCKGADIATKLGEIRSTKDVMFRSLTEISMEDLDTVLELIGQNSLYRGEEHKFAVTEFRKLKKEFMKAKNKEVFCWSKVKTVPGSVARFRNTVIGTLLSELGEGKELDQAIGSFEAKVAPANYKRPTAVITKAMIEKAKKEIEDLGLTSSLNRRYAVLEDISATNILFADRTAKPRMNDVFDELIAKTPTTPKKLDKVDEISIEDFISKILPQATTVEVMFEGQHTGNLLSLIAPADITAKTMFKWSNGFSWSYNGDMADSIKERVKKAGGKVEGDLCCRLAWDYTDDLDFHMMEPNGGHIYFSNKRQKSRCGGILDLDANGGDGIRADPAENIYYSNKKEMIDGTYELKVHNYCRRSDGVGFDVEIEFDGIIHSFHHDRVVKDASYISVAHIEYSKKDGFKILKSIPSTTSSKEVWGINTQSFHKVTLFTYSPNYWTLPGIGNKHYFFLLEGCINDGTARGMYNEFLDSKLDPHRKVLEMVGSRLRTDEEKEQLSGLGFSSTQHNSILIRVTGSFSRIVRVNF